MLADLSPRPGDLDPIETASRDELAGLQRTRMAATLRHAYANIPHYRSAFDAAGVHPDDFRDLADLARFPFTTKADLRANYPFGMFAVPRERIARIHASSGTTGKPTVVGYTKADLDVWADVMARSIRASGGRAGMRIHVAYGYGLFTGGLGAHYGAERLGCAVIPMGGGGTERQVQLIQDFQPDIIMVTPSYMLAILDGFRAAGADPRGTSLRAGIFGAEPWTNAMRGEIEADFDMHAVDIYGLSEVMGPGVANECVETKDGLHIWEDHFYPEVVDPDTGAVLPDGERGELVFTSLTKEATPVIRYRTRDLTRLLPRHRPYHAPDGEGDGPQRRHDDHPRRQRVPNADRGAGAGPRGPVRPLPDRADAGRPDGRDAGAGGGAPGRLRQHGRGRGAGAGGQGAGGRDGHRAGAAPGRHRAQPGQGPARGGPAAEGVAVLPLPPGEGRGEGVLAAERGTTGSTGTYSCLPEGGS